MRYLFLHNFNYALKCFDRGLRSVDKMAAMAAAWSELKPRLSDSVLKVIDKFGFQTMTPVQVSKLKYMIQSCIVRCFFLVMFFPFDY